ncbi:MAG: methyltransferase domain-containing protein [Kofleriaceae bacterium]
MSPGRVDLRTLERDGDVLRCECGARYPIVDGVPVVLPEADDFLSREALEAEPLGEAPLYFDGPDHTPACRLAEHLSTYLDAHWGDHATPPLTGAGLAPGMQAVRERIAARASAPVARAVELGCSVGRIVAELRAGAEEVVGLDLRLGALRRARRLLAGEAVEYGRRQIGRHYLPVVASPGPCADGWSLVCGDALDPPLLPGEYDRVVALGVFDSVRDPGQLLAVLDGLCAPGGEIILASPYAWQSGVVDEAARFGGADPTGALVARLRGGADLRAAYVIEDEAELPWVLRRDDRAAVHYQVHYLRAHKRG